MSVTSKDFEQSGWDLLPLSRADKRPTHSYRNSPVLEITQEALINESLGGRVGLRLGGYIALDIDSAVTHKSANLKTGLEFAKWLKDNGWFDTKEDMWQKTAGGGYHIIYKLPRTVVRNEHVLNKAIVNGIDIKSGETSFVVNHGNFNTQYARELPIGLYGWLRRHLYIVAERPKIIHRVRPSEIVDIDPDDELKSAQYIIEHAESGTRNQTLANQTWRVLNIEGIDSMMVREALLTSALAAGLDASEATATIDHAIRKRQEA
jgi:hypothetical protein